MIASAKYLIAKINSMLILHWVLSNGQTTITSAHSMQEHWIKKLNVKVIPVWSLRYTSTICAIFCIIQ